MAQTSPSRPKKTGTTKLWLLLCTLCGLTVVAELFIERHPHFSIDGFFGFYALLSFTACALLIALAKVLGLVLRRKEEYYDA